MSTSSFGQTTVTMARVIRAGPVLSLCFLDISQGSAKMSHPSSVVVAPRPPSLPPHHPPHHPPLAPPLAPPAPLPSPSSLPFLRLLKLAVREEGGGPTVERVPWSDPRFFEH